MPELFTAEGCDSLPAQELIDAVLAGQIVRITDPVTITDVGDAVNLIPTWAAFSSERAVRKDVLDGAGGVWTLWTVGPWLFRHWCRWSSFAHRKSGGQKRCRKTKSPSNRTASCRSPTPPGVRGWRCWAT